MGKRFDHHASWNAKQQRREQINLDKFAAFAVRQQQEHGDRRVVQRLVDTALQEIPEGHTGVLVSDEIAPEEVMARLRKLEDL